MQHAALGLWLALAAPEASAQPPQAPAATGAPKPSVDVNTAPGAAKPSVDVNTDAPPPSTYDKALKEHGEAPEPPAEEGRTMLTQLLRTVVSLGFVVALMYVLARVGLARLGKARGTGSTGLKLVERMQLDQKHALFVVEVSGKQRFLLGAGGDKGVTFIATLDAAAEPKSGSFEDALEKTQDGSVSTPGAREEGHS